jgi:hypothetical protein
MNFWIAVCEVGKLIGWAIVATAFVLGLLEAAKSAMKE